MAPTLVAGRCVSIVSSESHRCHTRTESLHDSINVLCLDAVDDEVAAPGHKVAVCHDFNIGLEQAQFMISIVL